jgi:hypothetical protein
LVSNKNTSKGWIIEKKYIFAHSKKKRNEEMKKQRPVGYYGRSPYSIKYQVGYPLTGRITLSEQRAFNKANKELSIVSKNTPFLVKQTQGKAKDFKKTKDYIFFEITDKQFGMMKEYSINGLMSVITDKQLKNPYFLRK